MREQLCCFKGACLRLGARFEAALLLLLGRKPQSGQMDFSSGTLDRTLIHRQ